MNPEDRALLFGFAAALGGGLLIGIERERRKGVGPQRALAGVRTFTLASLGGAMAGLLAAPLVEFAGAALVASLAGIAHFRSRSRDPGVTTELALFVTYLNGLLAVKHPAITAGVAVLIAALLASRRTLHRFSVALLSERELRDALLLATLGLIVLPLLPQAPIVWIEVSPRRILALVITFMGLQAAGHVALRFAGPRLGLSVSGFASGFVSSTGTIAALGTRSRKERGLLGACVSGALFSCVATVILLMIVVAAVYPDGRRSLAPSLGIAAVTALAAACLGLWRSPRSETGGSVPGQPFNLWHAVAFAAGILGITVVMKLASARWGAVGAGAAAAVTGLFDVHASAASTLSLGASGALAPSALLVPILIAFSSNTAAKLVAAFVAGGAAFGLRVATGLVSIAAAAWIPVLWVR